MPRRRKYVIRKREWLNPFPSEYDSYVSITVANSYDGENSLGDNVIHIADCDRRIKLHFDLHTPQERRQSLWKIDELLDMLGTFRSALYKESRLIDQHQRTSPDEA